MIKRGNLSEQPRGGSNADVHVISQLDRSRIPKRNKAAKELAKKVGIEIKHVYLTSGDDDFILIVDTPNGDNVAKFALALGSLGNVRTRTVRA